MKQWQIKVQKFQNQQNQDQKSRLRQLRFHVIRYDRKVKFFIIKNSWFYKYSLVALLILECVLSWLTKFNFYSWEVYEKLVMLFQCSILLGLREFFSSYINNKCYFQKTASIGLIISGVFNLILQECTNRYLVFFECFSITSITILTIILLYKLKHKYPIV